MAEAQGSENEKAVTDRAISLVREVGSLLMTPPNICMIQLLEVARDGILPAPTISRAILLPPSPLATSMTPSDPSECVDAHHLYSLALSATQIRSHLLNDKSIFSNYQDEHLIELTRISSNAATDLKTHTFTNSSQLLEFYESCERENAHYDLEI